MAPAPAVKSELPSDLDWAVYLDLKSRWGLSMAALVRRARDLGVIDQATYTRAMKQGSAYGWRRAEPGNDLRPLPMPGLLAEAVALAEMPIEDVAGQAGIPADVAERIIGPGLLPAVTV